MSDERERSTRMIVVSLRIRLPPDTWIADVSRSFPDATFRMLSGMQTGDTAVALGETVAENTREISEAVAAHPAIVTYQPLDRAENRSLARYETTDTSLYEFARESSLPPEFPIVARNGWFELKFTGTRAELDRVRDELDAAERPYELRSLVEVDGTAGLLTDRQREVLETGVREGYFEVPRECTLEELAAELDVDKSTASEILRRGERHVLAALFTGSSDEHLHGTE